MKSVCNGKLFCFTCLFVALFSFIGAVENSIIDVMETFEEIQNHSPQKYSKEQYKGIEDALKQKSHRIRLATYNMLFNLYDENLAPENRWPQRLPRIVELLNDMNADVIGTQELEPDQVKDLMALIEDQYEFFSIDSIDTELDGILFKKDRFSVIKKQVFIMKPTDTALTMVQLKDKKTGKSVAFCNAHFAFFDVEARTSQAHFVANKVKSIVKKMPVIFMGDLNTFPNRPEVGYPALDGGLVDQILTKHTLKDSITVSKVGHVGPIATFTNIDGSTAPFRGTGSPGVFLDHIYVSKGITVLIHAVQPGLVSGHFPSDHMPVIIDFVVP